MYCLSYVQGFPSPEPSPLTALEAKGLLLPRLVVCRTLHLHCQSLSPVPWHYSHQYLDDLSFFEGKLLFSSVWVWGHGQWVIVKQSHKDTGWELLSTRVSFGLIIEVWRKMVSPGVFIWSGQGTAQGTCDTRGTTQRYSSHVKWIYEKDSPVHSSSSVWAQHGARNLPEMGLWKRAIASEQDHSIQPKPYCEGKPQKQEALRLYQNRCLVPSKCRWDPHEMPLGSSAGHKANYKVIYLSHFRIQHGQQ